MTTTDHFTAWLVNDPTCLDQGCCDVTILEDELRGEPDDPNAWTSTTKGVFQTVTTVDAEDGDIDEAQREAEELMAAAGWRTVGNWDVTPTAYIVTVERAA